MSQYKMISIPEAVATVLAHTPVLAPEDVALGPAALGRVLARAVAAREALPPFPASIKDGYAVRHADGAGARDVVGESRAGMLDERGGLECGLGQAVYVTTGAPVPKGADCVVQIEDTRPVVAVPAAEGVGGGGGDGCTAAAAAAAAASGGEAARRQAPVKAGGKVEVLVAPGKVGQDIRAVGSDIEAGAEVLAAGERVGVAEVGLLATVGAVSLPARARPVVGVLSTGDEVVDPSRTPGPGQIRDCNRAMLLAAAEAAGACAVDLGIARDGGGDLSACLRRARDAGCDALVTSGGVSMGDRDLVKPLLEQAGEVHFGRVLMKPGKPLTFATLPPPAAAADNSGTGGAGKSMLVFGLPGNPVSSFVCFSLVVVPSLRKMAGWADPSLRRVRAALASPLRLDPERPEYHRATLTFGPLAGGGGADGEDSRGPSSFGWRAESTGNQISSRLLSARSANALLELPRAQGVLAAGTEVSALLLPGGLVEAFPQLEGGVPLTEGFE